MGTFVVVYDDEQSFLERWYNERQIHRWEIGNKRNEEEEGNSFGKLPYRVWNVGKYGPCADAAITGLMPPPLLELQVIVSIILLLQIQILFYIFWGVYVTF